MVKRVTMGNDNLDNMIGGGIPQGNQVLLVGTAGAGKTLLCMQSLYKNAQKGTEGLMISLEELKEQIITETKTAFSKFTDFDKLLDSGTIQIYDVEMFRGMLAKDIHENKKTDFINFAAGQRQKLISAFCKRADVIIKNLLSDSKIKIIVLDNVGIIRDLFDDDVHFRQFMTELGLLLKSYGVTGIYISEYNSSKPAEQEFFTFDGVITMSILSGSSKKLPIIEVSKMRLTDHSYSTAPYVITSSGVEILGLTEK